MPYRPGGVTQEDLDAAVAAVGSATSFEALDDAVSRFPAISTPIFHAYIRQHFLTAYNERRPDIDSIARRYDDLFFILHSRHHDDQANGPGNDAPAEPTHLVEHAPAALRALVDALDGSLPPPQGEPFDPEIEFDRAAAEAAGLIGRAVELPAYQPVPGTRWVVLVVRCARCETERLVLRPWQVDLVVAPLLFPLAAAGQTGEPTCRNCAGNVMLPGRVWVCETPFPPDTLACLATSWRCAPALIVLRPPTGTVRDEAADRLLEIRLDAMLRRAPFPDPPETVDDPVGSQITSMAVAYSAAELASILERNLETEQLPYAMEAAIRDLAKKLRDETMSLSSAEESVVLITEAAGTDWPMTVPPRQQDVGGDPHVHLVHLLVAATMSRQRHLGSALVPMLHAYVSHGFLALGEPALAQSMVARARAMADDLGDEAREIEPALLEAELEVLQAVGRHAEAAELRTRLGQHVATIDRSSIVGQLTALRFEAEEILGMRLVGDLSGALDRYPEHVAAWERLCSEASVGDDAELARHLSGIKLSYSGQLANFGAAVTDAGHWARAWELLSDDWNEYVDDEDARRSELEQLPIDLTTFAVATASLEPFFATMGDAVGSRLLYERAHDLLRLALPLSVEVQGWNFAGVQAHRLMSLASTLGDQAAATGFARDAVTYSSQVGDHARCRSAHLWLVSAHIAERDVEQAVREFELAVLESARELVGLGLDLEQSPSDELLLTANILLAVGADPGSVVAPLESIRGVRTAHAVQRDMPRSGNSESLAMMRGERERLRLEALKSPDGGGEELRDVEVRIDAAERRLRTLDEQFARWVDAADLSLASASDIRDAIEHSDHRAIWLTVLRNGPHVASIALTESGASVGDWVLVPNPPADVWPDEHLAAYGDALLAPHRDTLALLGPADRLVVSLPDEIAALPVGGLLLDGAPLCATTSAVVVHGFGMFEAAGRVEARPLETALIVGAPLRPERVALDGALAEARGVSADMAAAGCEVTTLTSAAATVAAVLEAAQTTDLVHISCHAERDDRSGASALLLAPDPRGGDSGWLGEERVLSDLLLRPGTIVNLAGCETGTVESSTGPILGGLVPRLLLAGARTVVASLWSIDDDATVAFQQGMYHHLLRGQPPAVALASAQRDAWSGRLGPELIVPAVWCAFVAYGAG